MTVPYAVAFSPEAQAHLQALFRYLAREASTDIARRYIDAVIDHCRALETFPRRGTPRDDLRPGLRTLAFRRRIVIAYAVANQTVVILGVFYGGQNVESILGEAE